MPVASSLSSLSSLSRLSSPIGYSDTLLLMNTANNSSTAVFLIAIVFLAIIRFVIESYIILGRNGGISLPLSRPMESNTDLADVHIESCALLFFGLGRAFKDVAYPSIKTNVLDVNKCDVFVHTFNVTKTQGTFDHEDGSGVINSTELIILTDGDPSKIMFETEEDFQRQRDVEHFRKFFPKPSAWSYPASMDNMIRQWHSVEKVWSLMETYEDTMHKRYDRIGLFRSDVFYTHPIPINNSSEVAVIPEMMYKVTMWGGFNDRMFYGQRKYGKVWSTERFKSVDAYLEWQQLNTDTKKKKGLHGEDFMKYLLTIQHPIPVQMQDICFMRIRSSGLILKGDCKVK